MTRMTIRRTAIALSLMIMLLPIIAHAPLAATRANQNTQSGASPE